MQYINHNANNVSAYHLIYMRPNKALYFKLAGGNIVSWQFHKHVGHSRSRSSGSDAGTGTAAGAGSGASAGSRGGGKSVCGYADCNGKRLLSYLAC
jgi:hypothetical protein